MPFLDRFSLDDLQRYSAFCRWGLWIPAAITVLLTFVSHKISDRILVLQRAEKAKSQERQKLADEQISAARAQADQANKIAAELEVRQRARRLPDDFLQTLTAELSKEPRKDIVEITCAIDDPEAWALAEQIRLAFVNAGFRFERIVPAMTSPPIIGIAICSRELTPGPIYTATAALLNHFKQPLEARPCPEHMKGTWIIQIGKKP